MASTYIVGDIHGFAYQLDELLSQIDKEWQSGDQIIFLGDYIDRGPSSKRVIDLLLDFKAGFGESVFFLEGNHEQWLRQAMEDPSRYSWLLGMEGLTTVRSYSLAAAEELHDFLSAHGQDILQAKAEGRPFVLPYERFFDAMGGEHRNFFRSLDSLYFDDDLVCSHSGLDPDKAFELQTEKDLYWNSPKRMLRDWRGPRTLAVGHLPTVFIDKRMRGRPIVTEKVLCLDTGVSMTGVLTAIQVPERRVFQASR